MKWAMAFVCMLALSCIAFAGDPFKVASRGDPFKVPEKWVDPFKPVKVDVTPAPKDNFKHDCGCPQLSCNCGAGGCHCDENRAENRVAARWVRCEEGGWAYFRGTRQLGAVNESGVYYPYDAATKTWGKPCRLPEPLPTKQKVMLQAATVCRT